MTNLRFKFIFDYKQWLWDGKFNLNEYVLRNLSIKIRFIEKMGMKCCTVDPELCIMHHKDAEGPLGTLIALMTKHVDDLKVCGSKDVVTWILGKVAEVFGQLKIEWHEFTNCGILGKETQIRSTNPSAKSVKMERKSNFSIKLNLKQISTWHAFSNLQKRPRRVEN